MSVISRYLCIILIICTCIMWDTSTNVPFSLITHTGHIDINVCVVQVGWLLKLLCRNIWKCSKSWVYSYDTVWDKNLLPPLPLVNGIGVSAVILIEKEIEAGPSTLKGVALNATIEGTFILAILNNLTDN